MKNGRPPRAEAAVVKRKIGTRRRVGTRITQRVTQGTDEQLKR